MKFFRRKLANTITGRQNKRAHYRLLPGKRHTVSARIVLRDGTTQATQLFDLSAGGAAIAFSQEDDPNYKIGDPIVLHFSTLRAVQPVRIEGRIANWVGGDSGSRYGVQFILLREFFETLDPNWYLCFNRRHIARALPPHDHKIPLIFGESDSELGAFVCDISPEGLSAIATGETAELLDTIAQVNVQIDAHVRISRNSDLIPVALQVRHRRQSPNGLVFGASFGLPDGAKTDQHLLALAGFTQKRLEDVALWNEAGEQ